MKPVIIGGGLAGLTVALSLAPMPVIVISPNKLGEECASAWAQGGIAAAIGTDDSTSLHAKDTIAVGGGLCDASVVDTVTQSGPHIIESLLAKYVPFDRDETGQLRLGLEAAHSKRRIVHAADSTGASVMKALITAVRAMPSIEIIENAIVTELITKETSVNKRDAHIPSPLAGRARVGLGPIEQSVGTSPTLIPPASGVETSGPIVGLWLDINGENKFLNTDKVVLAAGGAGALWQQTSNPLGSWGSGLALAARAGAVLGDLEFMQFHPTAIDIGQDPMPLASEALRGEGCTLIDENSERFVDELQPRDVVARALWAKAAAGHRTFLDGRTALGQNFSKRFPHIYASCMAVGIDPSTTPIPVRPAAHYHMGGVVTDTNGRTNVEGLWACGEVACTGLHGANRLASNSLLEAVSFGERVATSIKNIPSPSRGGLGRGESDQEQTSPPLLRNAPLPNPPHKGEGSITQIRTIMSQHVGMIRDANGLHTAIQKLAPLAAANDMALVGLMIAVSALQREESRGAHSRSDFPAINLAWQKRQTLTLADIMPIISPEKTRKTAGA